MRMIGPMQTAKSRAAEALKTVLLQISQIKLKSVDAPHPDLQVDLLAQLEVHGHSHTLVCKVEASGRPEHVRMALHQMQSRCEEIDGNSTVVYIAPRVSEEAQALCLKSRAGFLDLEGNARIDLGEVFIGKRSWPAQASAPARPQPASATAQEEELAGVA